MNNRFFALGMLVLLLSGCARKEISPSLSINGRYALDDGTGLSDRFLDFNEGKVSRYETTSAPTFAEGCYWNISESDFSLTGSSAYSFINGFLDAGSIWQGSASFKDGTLYLGNTKYSKLDNFAADKHYSSINTGRSEVILPYQSTASELSVEIVKPIKSGVLSAKPSDSWITDCRIVDNRLSFGVTETKTDRSGFITLSYTNAADVAVQVRQESSTHITTNPASASPSYTGGPASFTYSVENPIPGAMITVRSEVDWITGVQLSGNTVSYTVAENNSVAPREGTITLTYATANETFASYDFIVRQDGNPKKMTDLSAKGTANCYIVPKAGDYMFKATVKGGSSESVGTPVSAALLWESYGTSETPTVNSIIASLSYSNGYVTFSTPVTLRNGNAVIAVKNSSGTILWSWHIWVCKDFDPDATAQVYNNNAGTMMDRNLGATSAAKGDVEALGLLYQWGRKDPFLSGNRISSDIQASSTLSWPSAEESTSVTGTIDYAVKNPTTYITYNSPNGDWYYTGSSSTDNTRWQTNKGVYDPCPPGWRVPDGGSNGVWANAFGTSDLWITPSNWDSTNKGMDFGLTDRKLGSGTIWYPASGYLSGGRICTPSHVGRDGFYWSCSPDGMSAFALGFYDFSYIVPACENGRAACIAVRCLKMK